MDQMIFVEVLNRHGAVALRYPGVRLPATIGRAYDNDVIVDDPCIAAHHLRIHNSDQGCLIAVDLDTRNGLRSHDSQERLTQVAIDPDRPLKIGHTQLRIRPRDYVVADERPEMPRGSERSWLGASLLLTAAMTGSIVSSYSSTARSVEWLGLIAPSLWILLGILLWSGSWALTSRLVGQKANMFAHIAIASGGIAAFFVLATARSYLSFSLFSLAIYRAGFFMFVPLLAWFLYRHVRLVSRHARWALLTASCGIAAALVGTIWIAGAAEDTADFEKMTYLPEIKSPLFRLAPAQAPERFFTRTGALKREMDALRREP